jgi:hypothetical protein
MFLLRALVIALLTQSNPLQTGTGSIEGIVVRTGTTDPIVGANVELTRLEPITVTSDPSTRPFADARPPAIFRAVTGDDGKFQFRSLPEGRYRLVATRAGGSTMPAEYGQRDSRSRGTPLALADGQNLSGIRLSMALTGSITGRVWDADQDPVPNARVLALEPVYENGRRRLNTVQAVRTNDRGEYRLFWLPPGRYYIGVMRQDNRAFSFIVHVTPPDQFGRREDASSPLVKERVLDDGRVIEETAVLVYYGGGTNEQTAQPVDVLPGTSVAAVDVPLLADFVQSRHVKGLITGSDGQPAAGALVRLVPMQTAPQVILPSGVADKQGAFNIAGVIPGSYLLVASVGSTSGYSFSEGLFDVGNGTSKTSRIEVADRDIENLSIALQPAITLTGSLHVEGSTSARWTATQARISVVRDPNLLGLPNAQGLGSGNRAVQRPNGAPADDGTFVYAGLGQGDYRVNVGVIPSTAYIKAIRLGGVDVLRDGLRLEKAPENPLEIVLNLDGGSLEGVAVNEKSEPLGNATVVLIPDAPARNASHLYRTGTSDGSGTFEIKGIAPGRYKVFAWESVPKDIWHDSEFIRGVEAQGTSLNFTDAGRQQVRVTAISAGRQ